MREQKGLEVRCVENGAVFQVIQLTVGPMTDVNLWHGTPKFLDHNDTTWCVATGLEWSTFNGGGVHTNA